MLGHYLLEELGQLLAPDSNAPDKAEEQEGSSIWQILAPDPMYEASLHGQSVHGVAGHPSNNDSKKQRKAIPPQGAFTSSSSSKIESSYHGSSHEDEKVQCIHCHRWTPTTSGNDRVTDAKISSTTAPQSEIHLLNTPQPKALNDGSGDSKEYEDEKQLMVNALVLHAAKETAMAMTSPPNIAEQRSKVFRLCASSKPLNEKLQQRLKSLLLANYALLHCRSSHLGNLCPDGYTPLITAASTNNITAIKIILDVESEFKKQKDSHSDNEEEMEHSSCWDDRDLQGRTALHVAAEIGHVEAITYLVKYKYGQLKSLSPCNEKVEDHEQPTGVIGPDAPIDLTGHTPLGRAVTSRQPSARKNADKIQEVLFSPQDTSIVGTYTSKSTAKKSKSKKKIYPGRNDCNNPGSWAFGFSEMPGLRINMEDSSFYEIWKDKNGDELGLFGVCDGHGDNRLISSFISDNFATMFKKENEEGQDNKNAFITACSKIDEALRNHMQTKKTTSNNYLTSSLDGCTGGSTGLFALVSKKEIMVANVGDCRCLLIQQQKQQQVEKETAILEESMANMAVNDTIDGTGAAEAQQESKDVKDFGVIVTPLSKDHKPYIDEEMDRIENAGLNVISETYLVEEEHGEGEEATIKEETIWKVQLSEKESLAVSRAFGDFEYKNQKLPTEKQAIISVPDVRVHNRDGDTDLYLILACDGVYDVMSNEEIASYVSTKSVNDSLSNVTDSLLNECLQRGSRDNMSVFIIALSKMTGQFTTGGNNTELPKRALNFDQE